jgi:hypothetical protein
MEIFTALRVTHGFNQAVPDKILRRRRESKSKESVVQYPVWLQTANPSRNFSATSLINPLISR